MNRACSDCGHSSSSHASGRCNVLVTVGAIALRLNRDGIEQKPCNCSCIFVDEDSLGVSRDDLPFGVADDQPRQGPTYTYALASPASSLRCATCNDHLLFRKDGLFNCLNRHCSHFRKLLMPPVVSLLVVDGPCSPYPRHAP